ncbi:MAG: homoserine kinase [Gemmatimonadaceae bacterium]
MNPVNHAAVVAFAPGSIGNFGPGMDMLGCAMTGAGDEVRAHFTNEEGIVMLETGHVDLSGDPEKHACAIAANAVLQRAGATGVGIALSLKKGLPLSGGQGGSAASAVAAAVAVNALLPDLHIDTLDNHGLMSACLVAETAVAGRHLDNIAPSLLGGICCIRNIDPPDVARVPVNVAMWIAIAHPNISVRTADARSVLPQIVSQKLLIDQLASVGALITGLTTGDLELVGRALVDHYAEPARAALVPGFYEAKYAALEAGAVGGSFSGSGPSTFMVCATEAIALAAAEAMRWSFEVSGVSCSARVATIDFEGARWHRV